MTPNSSFKFVFVPLEERVFEIARRLAIGRQKSAFRLLAELVIDQALHDGLLRGQLPFEFHDPHPMRVIIRSSKGDLEWVQWKSLD